MSDPSPVTATLIRFGVFELDVRAGELRKAGVRLNLPDQPFQLLTALLERPGELVTRDELRPRLWPVDTFVDFEHGLNAAVKRLRDVLGDSADTPRFVETVPRRGYRFIAPVNGNEQVPNPVSVPAPLPPPPRARRQWWALLAGAALLTAAAAAGWRLRPLAHTDAPQKLVPLTTMTGHAVWPAFSPDGQQVAFAWQPEGSDNFDIYVKLVGLEEVRRLTTDPGNDEYPSWSPNGGQIAFLRQGSQGTTIHLVSPIGGGERKLNDFGAMWAPISWSPDGRYVAAGAYERPGHPKERGIFLLPAIGGEPRRLTPIGVVANSPAFSSDGRRLAYVSCERGTDCPLKVFDLDTEFAPTGPPRSLTPQAPYMTWGMTWSRDGRSVIYGAFDAGGAALWRVRVDEGSPPERIDLAGVAAASPAMPPSGNRLAFSRDHAARALYRFEAGRASQPFLTSSVNQGSLDFSQDGRRMTYCARTGETIEVWTANSDGSAAQQLTHGPGRWQCSPRWSPDGERVVFDSEGPDGEWHIWSIAADGGTPRQVTKEGRQGVPSWSRDGQWIYYSSSGNIWRIHVADGQRQRLTSEGGVLLGLESGDGKNLLYQRDRDGALLMVPLAGGGARQIAPCVSGWAVAATSAGIYYASCSANSYWGGTNPLLHLVNPATDQDRVLGTLEKFSLADTFGLAVSADGKVIVYNRVLREGHDLMLIENFR